MPKFNLNTQIQHGFNRKPTANMQYKTTGGELVTASRHLQSLQIFRAFSLEIIDLSYLLEYCNVILKTPSGISFNSSTTVLFTKLHSSKHTLCCKNKPAICILNIS